MIERPYHTCTFAKWRAHLFILSLTMRTDSPMLISKPQWDTSNYIFIEPLLSNLSNRNSVINEIVCPCHNVQKTRICAPYDTGGSHKVALHVIKRVEVPEVSTNRHPWLDYPTELRMLRVTYSTEPQSIFPDSKVHGANMGPTWERQDPCWPHVGPMNFAIWVKLTKNYNSSHEQFECIIYELKGFL